VDDLRTLLACGALLPALLAGCATPTQPYDNAPSAALEEFSDTPADPAETPSLRRLDLADAARRAADDMALLMNRTAKPRIAPSVEPMDDQRPWQSRDTDESEEVASRQDGPAESQERTQLPPTDTGTDSAPPPDPIALMLGRLETEMQDPERALAATFLAQAIRDYVDADDGSRPSQNLSPPERELAELLGPLLDALTTGDRADAPNRIGVAIDDAARGLASVLPVRINDAALATDIYGFAAYRPFESYVFLAGRSNRMLVYTEPANFESRLATEPTSQGGAPNPGAYEVVLGLELQLYNERGSMLAWRRPEERVSIRSDRPRSEVYLGTMIDLPASLSVGRYQLKVVLRDYADGSQDERVIPIEMVADPRLTTRATRTP